MSSASVVVDDLTSESSGTISSDSPIATSDSNGNADTTPTKGKGKKRKTVESSRLRDSISIALVCQSNLNRSMEAHWALQEKGNIRAYSFGAGSKVRLPGETIDRPHVYEFGTPYDTMYKDLERKNRSRFTRNGMLQMLDRDRQLKESPERWQDHYEKYQNDAANKRRKSTTSTSSSSATTNLDDDTPPKPKHFDIVITYEKRVYDIVQADIEARSSNPSLSMNLPTHLLNIDTTDNHAEAAVSANLTLELVEAIYAHSKKSYADDGDDDDSGDENDDSKDDDEDGDGGEDWVDKIDDIIDEFEKKNHKEVGHTVLFY